MDTGNNRAQRLQIFSLLEQEGYKDPYVVAEMIKRIEGEINRKMKEQLISLPDALVKVMHDVHKDFKLPGKYPILSYYQELVKKEYRSVYRGQLKKAIFSPASIVAALGVAALAFKAYGWCEVNYRIWDVNVVSILLFATWLCSSLMLFLKFSFSRRSSMVVSYVTNRDPWLTMLVFILMPMHRNTGNALLFTSLICTAGWLYVVLISIAKYTTLKLARKDVEIYVGHINGELQLAQMI